MLARLLFLLIPAVLIADRAWPDDAPKLEVGAVPAVVHVKALPKGRRSIRLPALEFELRIQANCGSESKAQSVSISIADTRRTFNDDILANISDELLTFSISARQLAPVAVEGFCLLNDDRELVQELLIQDAVSIHSSLRCAGDDDESITYASHALDVMLQCNVPTANQGSSESEIAR
jgi:hypothetical protein